jgi:hypothetical protein
VFPGGEVGDPCRKPARRSELDQESGLQGAAGERLQRHHDLGSRDAVAAEIEEVVVHPGPVKPQGVRKGLGDRGLDRIFRFTVGFGQPKGLAGAADGCDVCPLGGGSCHCSPTARLA